MMYTKSNGGHEYANTYVRVYDNGAEEMISYTTKVLELSPEGWVTCYGLYSMTTIKHIGWFMRSHDSSYQVAKQCYVDGKQFNLYTGEFRDRVWD